MIEIETQPHPGADADADFLVAAVAPPLFNTLPLDPKLLRAVIDSGYTAMTPIQAKAIPIVLAGRDVMGAAVPGSTAPAAATTAARWQPHA